MKVGVVLPHLGQFGGVRRYLEIGNVLVKRGIGYTIFVRKPKSCKWFKFNGRIQSYSKIKADKIIFSYPPIFKLMRRAKGKIFVYVNAGGGFIRGYKKVYRKYPFIINHRAFRKYFPKSHLIEGGVNVHQFRPPKEPRSASQEKVRVLFYNDRSSLKGGNLIRHKLKGIKGIQLVPLKGLDNEQLSKAYRNGDFFISWESRLGWPNMAAEALASGLTVVSRGFNCEPFIDKIIRVKDAKHLRHFFSKADIRTKRKIRTMDEFSWERVCDKLMKVMEGK